jgi:selenium-binding protein 1
MLSHIFCRIHKWVEGSDIANAAGTAYPHTSHCLGSGEIMISTMGNNDGKVRQTQQLVEAEQER